MRLDDKDRRIVQALVRNSRLSDNRVGAMTGISVRTVSRRRAALEEHGVLSYHTSVDMHASGTGRFNTRQMVTIRFELGVTRAQLIEEIRSEPNVASVFSELILESYIAESDGHVCLVLVVEGESEADVTDNLQGKIVPSLKKNHGEGSIIDLNSVRLLDTIRKEHNYVPMVNMRNGVLRDDWPDEAIFVG